MLTFVSDKVSDLIVESLAFSVKTRIKDFLSELNNGSLLNNSSQETNNKNMFDDIFNDKVKQNIQTIDANSPESWLEYVKYYITHTEEEVANAE